MNPLEYTNYLFSPQKGGGVSLVPSPCAPPGEKRSGEQSQIFLGLFPKSGKDQWDFEIGNYYVALPLQQ